MHAINTAYPVKKDTQEVTVAYRDTAGTWHDVPALPERGKGNETKFSDVMAWRVTMPTVVVVDEIQLVVAAKRIHAPAEPLHRSAHLRIRSPGTAAGACGGP